MSSSRTPNDVPPLELERDSVGLLPKTKRSDSTLCKASVSLNLALLFSIVIILVKGESLPPAVVDTSRSACNDHGVLYDAESAASCSCFECWTGPQCSERIPTNAAECIVQANSGTPLMFENYWVHHPEATIKVAPSYHIGYGDEMPRLKDAIRSMHALVGNAVVDETKHVVVGVGSTELINAALFALASGASTGDDPALVWTQSPYYSGYRTPAEYFRSSAFEWTWHANPNASVSVPPVPSATRRVIELVTSPNNPDGRMRAPLVRGPQSRVVMDHAYLWPHFVAVPPPVDYKDNGTVALFTLSKVSGHASTRIGWAITSCPHVAERMETYIRTMHLGSPRENELRAVAAIEHIVSHGGELFRYARSLMLQRWQRLERLFALHATSGRPTTYSLQARESPSFDAFSGASAYAPSPAYAWIQKLDGGDCMAAMLSVGIVGRPGSQFGATKAFARLELLMREQTFAIMVPKLASLLGVVDAASLHGM
mmetsp:Transcript_37421/g.98995  ORF Transcript_37421/g.98995 Transcript_37421/m.98995 type:complete len:486 (-) Transcript_37421:201-1658(-)